MAARNMKQITTGRYAAQRRTDVDGTPYVRYWSVYHQMACCARDYSALPEKDRRAIDQL